MTDLLARKESATVIFQHCLSLSQLSVKKCSTVESIDVFLSPRSRRKVKMWFWIFFLFCFVWWKCSRSISQCFPSIPFGLSNKPPVINLQDSERDKSMLVSNLESLWKWQCVIKSVFFFRLFVLAFFFLSAAMHNTYGYDLSSDQIQNQWHPEEGTNENWIFFLQKTNEMTKMTLIGYSVVELLIQIWW